MDGKNQELAWASWFSRFLNEEGVLPLFIVECYGDMKYFLLVVNKPVAVLTCCNKLKLYEKEGTCKIFRKNGRESAEMILL